MPSPESGHKIGAQEIKGLEKHYLLPRVSQETADIVEGIIDKGKLGQEFQHVFAEENEVLFEHMNFLLGKLAEIRKSAIPYDGSDPWLTGYHDGDPLFIAKDIYLLLEKQGAGGKKKGLLPKVTAETITDNSDGLKNNPDQFDQEMDIAKQDNPHFFEILYKMADRYEDKSNIGRINFEMGQLAYYILRTQAQKEGLSQEL